MADHDPSKPSSPDPEAHRRALAAARARGVAAREFVDILTCPGSVEAARFEVRWERAVTALGRPGTGGRQPSINRSFEIEATRETREWLGEPRLIPSAAGAVGTFNNGVIADKALTYPVGSYGGQCRVFVNNVVKASTGINLAYGAPNNYFQAFADNGAQRITNVADLRWGDIVQQSNTESSSSLRTYIIIARVLGSTYDVVDSNHNRDERVDHYHRAVTLSDAVRTDSARSRARTHPPRRCRLASV